MQRLGRNATGQHDLLQSASMLAQDKLQHLEIEDYQLPISIRLGIRARILPSTASKQYVLE